MSVDPRARYVYKICSAAEWREAAATGVYLGSAVDRRDGFIHLSTGDQLGETLHRHFAGQRDLILVALDSADLTGALRWEPSRGGELFPHLYDSLAVHLARQVSAIDDDRDF